MDKNISLGEFLRNEREQRGITIEQVASSTKIGIRSLHALEGENYAELPAKPFIRGFVTSYCRFIGLDPKEVLARFDDYIAQKSTERPNREGGHSGYAFEKREGEQGKTILLIAIFSFISVGGVAMIFLKPSLHHHKKSHVEKLRAVYGENATAPIALASTSPTPGVTGVTSASLPAVQANAPSLASPTPSPAASSTLVNVASATSESAETPKKPGSDPLDPLDSGHELKQDQVQHRIVFKIDSDTWVRYQVDNRPMRRFVVRKGKTLVLRAENAIAVQISKPTEVSFKYNQQSQTRVSEANDLERVHGDATLFFGNELAEKIKELFEKEKALPKKVPASLEPLAPV